MEFIKECILIPLLIGIIGIAIIGSIAIPIQWFRCHQQWDKSGMGVSYRLVAGCMLTLKDGTEIPDDHFRVLP